MPKKFSLHQLMAVVAVIMLLALIFVPVLALDRGPQHLTTAITAHSVLSTNTALAAINLPMGDTGRFNPGWLIFTGNFVSTNGTGTNAVAVVNTQTVSYIISGYTGAVATVAAPGVIVLTNLPTMFYGDQFVTGPVTNLASNAVINATVSGRLFD